MMRDEIGQSDRALTILERLKHLEPGGVITLREAVAAGARLLSNLGIESPRLDAELLLAEALGCRREELFLNYEAPLGAEARKIFRGLLRRRSRREPVAYITEKREFWSLEFFVTTDVLVPRPETEVLVETAVGLLARPQPFPLPQGEGGGEGKAERTLRILDLGTGSGAIAVSLARERGDAEIWATDLSPAAVKIARINALRHGVERKVHFLEGDLFEPVKRRRGFFHLIVSNPPYVRRSEIGDLPPEARDWEPRLALDGGPDGLDFYRRIIAEGHLYLTEGGFLVLEIDARTGDEVGGLLVDSGRYGGGAIFRDYAGKPRVVAARRLT